MELKRLEFFRQRKAKKDSEIALLHTFYQTRGVESTDFLAQLKDMSNLLDALKQIPSITKVFNTFQMHNCTAHPSYQALVELKLQFSTEEQEDNLTGAEATKRMEEVLKIIHPLELPQLELFSVAGRSAEFYAFLKTIQQQGEGRFKDLHRLITQIMQHEEYNEAVLNQLPRAREYMLPFLDQDLEFDKLLLRIKAMCDRVRVLEDFGDLETINQNMNLIRLWFSKAEVSFFTCAVSFVVCSSFPVMNLSCFAVIDTVVCTPITALNCVVQFFLDKSMQSEPTKSALPINHFDDSVIIHTLPLI